MERFTESSLAGRSETDRPEQKVIVVIPARGGSKGIPDKNLVLLGKWTLLEHTVKDAYELKCPIYVTTDDQRIGYLAQEADCVYVKRPEELAQDVFIQAMQKIDQLRVRIEHREQLNPCGKPREKSVEVNERSRTSRFVIVMALFLWLTDKTLEWVLYDLILGWRR